MMLLGDALPGHQLLRAYSPRCWEVELVCFPQDACFLSAGAYAFEGSSA